MRAAHWSILVGLVAAMTFGIGSTHAAIIFSDNFDGEPGSGLQQNYATFANWNVSNGSVDLLQTPPAIFGVSCPSAGKCLDMDGSTTDAGRLDTKTLFNLAAGDYVLSFTASGNQRGLGSDTMSFGFGSISSSITLAPLDAFATFTLPFTLATATSGLVFFEHAGGDNVGIILDNIVLDSRVPNGVPEPSTLLLVGLAVAAGAIGLRRRRH